MNIKGMKKYDYFKKDIEYSFDSLTELLNEQETIGFVNWLIQKNIPFTVGISDIDNFKMLNDGYGHMIGDEALVAIAHSMEEVIGQAGLIGRIGGDEFMIIIPNVTEYNDVWNYFHNINVKVGTLVFNKVDELSVSVTTGVARFPMDGATYNELYEKADKALYRGKTKGRNCFIIYLAAKHANLMLKKESEKTFSSMEAISRLFEISVIKTSIKDKISSMIKYLLVYTAVDYVAVQSNSKIVASLYNQTCQIKTFDYIPLKLYERGMNSIGLQYTNDRKVLLQSGDKVLHDKLKKQNIYAFFMMKICIADTNYGILVINSASSRVWQTKDMELFILTSKIIANVLRENNLTLEEVYK